jgi:5-methylcytosine-specific restriction endonuclease McrA
MPFPKGYIPYNKGKKVEETLTEIRSSKKKNCFECENIFIPVRESTKFCSNKCKYSNHARVRVGDKAGNYKGGITLTEIHCLFCNKITQKYWVQKFCDSVCFGKYLQKEGIYKNENNPQWRGGVHVANYIIRRSPEYFKWRARVLKRDNHTCVECGAVENVQADHIKPFAWYPELRFEVSNGRTLCIDCHKKTSSYLSNKKPKELV